jgi:hypothetical protein
MTSTRHHHAVTQVAKWSTEVRSEENGELVDMLKVGIVGSGWMGHVHARAWQSNATRAEVVAVADVSPERTRNLAKLIGEREVARYPDLTTMLAEADLDAVDICLPHHLHADAILTAAQAGKAILCEKPLCTSLDDAVAIQAALRDSGAVFMSAHNQLFQPQGHWDGRSSSAPSRRFRTAVSAPAPCPGSWAVARARGRGAPIRSGWAGAR